MRLAWHYMGSDAFEEIMKDGFLRPSKGDLERHGELVERPVIWFTLNQIREETILPAEIEIPDHYEYKEPNHLLGFYRLGIDRRRLLRWPDFGRKAGMIPPHSVEVYEDYARQNGINPRRDWRGSFETFPLSELVVGALVERDGFAEWANVTLG